MPAGGPAFGPDASPHAIIKATIVAVVSAIEPEASRMSAVRDSRLDVHPTPFPSCYGHKLHMGVARRCTAAGNYSGVGGVAVIPVWGEARCRWQSVSGPARRRVADIAELGNFLDEDLSQLIDSVVNEHVAGA